MERIAVIYLPNSGSNRLEEDANCFKQARAVNYSILFWTTKLNSKWLKKVLILFFKWPNPGLLFVYFCPFLIAQNVYNFNNTNWIKQRWCCRDSNPWPQDGRRRRNHQAMSTALLILLYQSFPSMLKNSKSEQNQKLKHFLAKPRTGPSCLRQTWRRPTCL